MPRRFSAQELRKLRNAIPIDFLIQEILMIPSKVSEGCFRFLCPLCSEFNTAISQENNLARCFPCQKQFNTIDLVMDCKQTEFVESVRFLQKYQDMSFPKNLLFKDTKNPPTDSIGNTNHNLHSQYDTPQTTAQQPLCSDRSRNDTCSNLEPLGEILKKCNLIPNSLMFQKSVQDQHPKLKQDKKQQNSAMIQYICELEQNFESLSKQLQNIKAKLLST
jgi:hypothetical protein